MDDLGADHFITMRSFTVELQTYIEQGATAELHTVTVRNVVELGFRCDVCEEALKTFDSLTTHWKSGICGTDDIGAETAISLIKSPVKTLFSDHIESEILEMSDSEVNQIDTEPTDKIETKNGVKEYIEDKLVVKDCIVQQNSVESLLLAEHALSTQTEISQCGDQNAENISEKSIELNNVENKNTLVNPVDSNIVPTESTDVTIENVNSTNDERSQQFISQSDIYEIQENSVESSAYFAVLKCTICNKFFPKNELEEHTCIGKCGRIKCNDCEKEFNTSADLKKHSKVHNAVKTFQCSQCDKIYVQKFSLKLHMLKHTGEKPYKCALCEKSFSSKNDHSRHEARHAKLKPHQCQECGKKFADKSYLNLHLKRHKDETSYSCDICHRSFTTRSQLTMHGRKHTGEKPHGCQMCDKTFASLSTLKYHQATHTGQRPFTCEICPATFISKTALRAHNRVHTGEKPYKCEICGRSFASNFLKQHMRYHTGEKPFKCSICGNQFVTKQHLATHLRCHSGEKPYSCDKCDKCFGHKSSLCYHLRSHTGEKPFSCPVCEKRFIDSQSMKRHAITCANKRLGKKKNFVSTPTDITDTSKTIESFTDV